MQLWVCIVTPFFMKFTMFIWKFAVKAVIDCCISVLALDSCWCDIVVSGSFLHFQFYVVPFLPINTVSWYFITLSVCNVEIYAICVRIMRYLHGWNSSARRILFVLIGNSGFLSVAEARDTRMLLNILILNILMESWWYLKPHDKLYLCKIVLLIGFWRKLSNTLLLTEIHNPIAESHWSQNLALKQPVLI